MSVIVARGRGFAIEFERTGFRAFVAFNRREADALARLHIDETGTAQYRSVQEHVFPTRIRGDEAEALGGIEPFYRAFAAFAGRATAIGPKAAAETTAITAAEAATITTTETAAIPVAEATAIPITETTPVATAIKAAAEAATTIPIAIAAETTCTRRTRRTLRFTLRIFDCRGVIDFQHARHLTALLAGSDFTGNCRPFFQLLQPGALNHRHVNEHVF